VIWSMPGRLWVYNWTLSRWSIIDVPALAGLSTGINASVSLEGVDTLYPSGIDSVPYSLDDPIFQGGDPFLTIAKTDNVIYAFGSSSNLAATFSFPTLEPFKGRHARVRRARLGGDAVSGVTLTISDASRLGDSFSVTTANATNADGYIPIRATNQFLKFQLDIAAGATWSYATALDFDMAPGGSR